jgi:hypothetical protein
VLLCTTVAVAAPLLTWATGVDPRLVGMVSGSLALCILFFQLIDSWSITTLLAKVLVLALILSLLFSVMATIQLRHNPLLVTVVTYPLIAHRVGCIMIGLYWRWLLCFDVEESKHRLVTEGSEPPA